MTKAELVAAIAERAGLKRSQARDALDAFVESVASSLKAGQEVRLVGFGSFVPVRRAAGVARNPRTGETVRRPASQSCRFRAGDALKSTLNGQGRIAPLRRRARHGDPLGAAARVD